MSYSRRVAGRGWLRSLSAVCALALPAAASANAGVFFGAGGQVTPIKNEDVRLVKERVSIRPRIDGRPGKWGAPFFIRADVEAEFLLANTADRPVELQVGFPLVGELDHSILDFHAREGGSERPVATKRGLVELKRDRDRTFETVVAWNETFGSLQAKTITVTYRMLLGVAPANLATRGAANAVVMGGLDEPRYEQLDNMFRHLAYVFFYVTKTAYTWRGPIESALFVLDCTELARDLERFDFTAPRNELLAGVGRPVVVSETRPPVSGREKDVFRWEFQGAVPEDGLFAKFTLLLIPASAESVPTFVAEQTRRLEQGLTPDEYVSVVHGYYARLLKIDPGTERAFVRKYFEPVELVRGFLFEKDEKLVRGAMAALQSPATSGSR